MTTQASAPITQTAAVRTGPASAVGHPSVAGNPVAGNPSGASSSTAASSSDGASVEGVLPGRGSTGAPAASSGRPAPGAQVGQAPAPVVHAVAGTLATVPSRTPVRAAVGPVLAGSRPPSSATGLPSLATVVTPATTRVQSTVDAVPAEVPSAVSAGATLVATGARTVAPPSVHDMISSTPGAPTVLADVRTVVAPRPPATAGQVSGTARGPLAGQRRSGSAAGSAGSQGGGPGATPERDLPVAAPSAAIASHLAPTEPAASGLGPAGAAVEQIAGDSVDSARLPAASASAGARVAAGEHVGVATSRRGFLDEGRLMVTASPFASRAGAQRAGGLLSGRGPVDPSSASGRGGELTPLAPAGSSPSVAGSSSATGLSLLLTLAILAIACNAMVGRRLRLASLLKRAAPVLLLPTRPG